MVRWWLAGSLLLLVAPGAQACTEPVPSAVPDFEGQSWQGGELWLTVGGKRLMLDSGFPTPSQSHEDMLQQRWQDLEVDWANRVHLSGWTSHPCYDDWVPTGAALLLAGNVEASWGNPDAPSFSEQRPRTWDGAVWGNGTTVFVLDPWRKNFDVVDLAGGRAARHDVKWPSDLVKPGDGDSGFHVMPNGRAVLMGTLQVHVADPAKAGVDTLPLPDQAALPAADAGPRLVGLRGSPWASVQFGSVLATLVDMRGNLTWQQAVDTAGWTWSAANLEGTLLAKSSALQLVPVGREPVPVDLRDGESVSGIFPRADGPVAVFLMEDNEASRILMVGDMASARQVWPPVEAVQDAPSNGTVAPGGAGAAGGPDGRGSPMPAWATLAGVLGAAGVAVWGSRRRM